MSRIVVRHVQSSQCEHPSIVISTLSRGELRWRPWTISRLRAPSASCFIVATVSGSLTAPKSCPRPTTRAALSLAAAKAANEETRRTKNFMVDGKAVDRNEERRCKNGSCECTLADQDCAENFQQCSRGDGPSSCNGRNLERPRRER